MTEQQLFFENWNLFWNAFGSIGTTIGSLITAGAVMVALMQYKQPFVKKIKLDFSLGMVNFEEEPKMYYSLKFINSGIRECTISSICIKGKNKNIFILSPTKIPAYKNPQMPFCLKAEQSCDMFFEYDDFRQRIKNMLDGGWKPKYRRFRIYVTDSAGDVYCGKSRIKMSGFRK